MTGHTIYPVNIVRAFGVFECGIHGFDVNAAIRHGWVALIA
jgi:hypothetical protein